MKDRDNQRPAAPQAENADEAAFRELIGGSLQRMDGTFEPEVPQMSWFAGLVKQQRRELRRRLIRDLMLLWIVGCAAIGGMALLVTQSLAGFALLQGAAAAGAVLFLGGNAVRRGKRPWAK